MIIEYQEHYASQLKNLMIEFYNSPAVMHSVDSQHFNMTIDLLNSQSPFQECFLFLDNDNVIGYALVAVTYSNEAGGMVAWLDEFYIMSEFRGKGIGGKFLEYVDNRYGNFARIRLEIDSDNTKAERLYISNGYKLLPYKQLFKGK